MNREWNTQVSESETRIGGRKLFVDNHRSRSVHTATSKFLANCGGEESQLSHFSRNEIIRQNVLE